MSFAATILQWFREYGRHQPGRHAQCHGQGLPGQFELIKKVIIKRHAHDPIHS